MNDKEACEVLERLKDAFDGKPVLIPTIKEINDAVETLNPIIGDNKQGITTGTDGIREINAHTAKELNKLAEIAKTIRDAREQAATIAETLPQEIAEKVRPTRKM